MKCYACKNDNYEVREEAPCLKLICMCAKTWLFFLPNMPHTFANMVGYDIIGFPDRSDYICSFNDYKRIDFKFGTFKMSIEGSYYPLHLDKHNTIDMAVLLDRINKLRAFQ
jgi:hypothetical protein